MDSFRLKLAVILVNSAWNKIKASLGFKISDVEEPYMLEETEKRIFDFI
jgi:predicted metalloendopeptidase